MRCGWSLGYADTWRVHYLNGFGPGPTMLDPDSKRELLQQIEAIRTMVLEVRQKTQGGGTVLFQPYSADVAPCKRMLYIF